MSITAIESKANFFEVLDSPDLIVLDCWATWCGPCRAIEPKMNEFGANFPQVKFYKVDVDAVPDVAQELGIRAMPTIVYFKNGQKFNEVVGADLRAIEEGIKSLISA